MTIEVVFFDAGETLIRPHPSFTELFATVSARRGHAIRPADVAAVRQNLAPYLVDLAHDTGIENPSLDPEDSRTFWLYLYRRFLTELEIDDAGLADELYAVFSSTSTYKLFDDVLDVLVELGERYRLGLISNFERWLEEILIEQEVGHLFDVQVISGSAGVEKPDPLIYRIALERAGVAPDRSVHVGDSPTMDAEPARSVGMHAVLIDRDGRLPSSDVPTISSMKELPGAVAKLNG